MIGRAIKKRIEALHGHPCSLILVLKEWLGIPSKVMALRVGRHTTMVSHYIHGRLKPTSDVLEELLRIAEEAREALREQRVLSRRANEAHDLLTLLLKEGIADARYELAKMKKENDR